LRKANVAIKTFSGYAFPNDPKSEVSLGHIGKGALWPLSRI